MSPPQDGVRVETKLEAEALIPLFKLDRILNQDQSGRRITLLGTVQSLPALLTLERAAFPTDSTVVSGVLGTLVNTTNLGANDVYRWYMSNHSPFTAANTSTSNAIATPDLKLNLIYPCTPTHIRKYTSQQLRYVTETSEIYRTYVRPWIEQTQRTPKRLDWIYNVLDGITEQDDVVYRSSDFGAISASAQSTVDTRTGFILLPDLNWDRKTLSALHLLALVERRDITSIRDLKKSHVPWLRNMLVQIKEAAARRGTELARAAGEDGTVESDQIKCYVHYHPTYYHFHVHVVHVMLEPEGGTQSVGKAFGLEGVIALLQGLSGAAEQDPGLDAVDITYHVGEAAELWKKCFGRLKNEERVDLIESEVNV